MKIAFRADASIRIGTGHVMRCLTLAEALNFKSVYVVFVCRDHLGNLCNLIASKGFEVIKLGRKQNHEIKKAFDEKPLSHASWLGVSQNIDANQTLDALLQINASWDWLIVDHYALDYRWESVMRKAADKIMVIDDLADRRHDCDLLLDQNYFQNPDIRYKDLIPLNCKILLTPKYALLRPEFREAKKFCRMRGNSVGRVLVYFGGNDPENLTGMALNALNSPELKHLLVDVVIGFNNPNQKILEALVNQRNGTRLHIQPEGFIELMLRADLFLGAGGTTTWERLCLGLPSLVITVAKNQEAFTNELNRIGFVFWLGKKGSVSIFDIKNGLCDVIEKLKKRSLYKKLPNPVDGLGALRVTEKLIASDGHAVKLRRATSDDMELFYYWANDPLVRKNSFGKGSISWRDHTDWFKNRLESCKTIIWVIETAVGLPFGQVRFNLKDGIADIHYSLDSIVRGRGWRKILLQQALSLFKNTHPDISCNGWVKSYNMPSKRCFQQLGIKEESIGEEPRFSLAIISDIDSWINQYIPDLLYDWMIKGYRILWVHDPDELLPGDICFMLGCSQMIPLNIRNLFNHNLVVHESDLPLAKGWSPLTWQILEGKNQICVTLLEAEKKVDSGKIYAQEWIEFQGKELVDDLRLKQAETTISLCKRFVNEYPAILGKARKQKGNESYYPRRNPSDSRLALDKNIKEQFNLLRVVDNKKYPAFFELYGQKYILKIEKR